MRLAAAFTLTSMVCAPALVFAGPHDFVVEHAGAGGDQETAQPYIDAFLRYIEDTAGWTKNTATGVFAPTPEEAIAAVEKKKPGFGMFDPDLFLAKRKAWDLEVIATVEGTRQTSEKMVIVAKDAALKTLDQLKGKRLASTHFQSMKFLDKMIFDGKIETATFFKPAGEKFSSELSIVKAIRKVNDGKADAAMMTESEWKSQQAGLGKELHVVFTSAHELPPTPVVAFGKSVTAKDREAFTKAIVGMDKSAKGQPVLQQLDIRKFAAPDKAAYDDAIKRYEK